jgi:hypothetical protein
MSNFERIYTLLGEDLLSEGKLVETHWQAQHGVPQNRTVELLNSHLLFEMPATKDEAANEFKPDLPWADEHFDERVSRIPHNPPPSASRWRDTDATKAGVDATRIDGDKFSHTYPERFWPKFANGGQEYAYSSPPPHEHEGIRYPYGDLDDVVSLLAREPYTRQAYLPVWFPEDTGAVPGARVPCTLGYHFVLRDQKLHCFYPIRSCDFLRHFRNDVYLAVRLTQWVRDQVLMTCPKSNEAYWVGVTPGNLTMHIVSLHIFEGDMPYMRQHFQEGDEWNAM